MRTRSNNWLDMNTRTVLYGLDVRHDGKWMHVVSEGKPCLFRTEEERNAKRAELRKIKSL